MTSNSLQSLKQGESAQTLQTQLGAAKLKKGVGLFVVQGGKQEESMMFSPDVNISSSN